MDAQTHWSSIYRTKSAQEMSWYQPIPALSLDLIERAGIGYDEAIIDVGAGASTLVDHLIGRGYQDVTLLDLSGEALRVARERVGETSARLNWIVGDVTTTALPEQRYALWHDRAVFHFLTDADARRRYIAQARQAVRAGGYVLMATFALDGPEQCSNLPVMRYDADTLTDIFGPAFKLAARAKESHRTPSGAEQRFEYTLLRLVTD